MAIAFGWWGVFVDRLLDNLKLIGITGFLYFGIDKQIYQSKYW